MARRAPAPPPPLLAWCEAREIKRMAAERAALADQIARMRPRSRRRTVLAARLADITRRQLARETELRRGA